MVQSPYLGELEQAVLWTVLRHDGVGYGATILKELNGRMARRVTPGALYTTIDRLQEKGLITSMLAEPTPGRGGRRKRFLSVTDEGRAALARVRREWEGLWEGLRAEGSPP